MLYKHHFSKFSSRAQREFGFFAQIFALLGKAPLTNRTLPTFNQRHSSTKQTFLHLSTSQVYRFVFRHQLEQVQRQMISLLTLEQRAVTTSSFHCWRTFSPNNWNLHSQSATLPSTPMSLVEQRHSINELIDTNQLEIVFNGWSDGARTSLTSLSEPTEQT